MGDEVAGARERVLAALKAVDGDALNDALWGLETAAASSALMDKWPLAWCDNCRKTQPLITDVLPANEKNDHAVLDLVCGDCHFVIATLHGRVVAAVQPEEAKGEQ